MQETRTPNHERAKALRKMAESQLRRLEETPKQEYPSQTIVDYHDIMHKYCEAIASEEGINFRGERAHEELIDYVARKRTLPEASRRLLQDLRKNRNRVQYEGLAMTADFITNNESRIKNLIKQYIERFQ